MEKEWNLNYLASISHDKQLKLKIISSIEKGKLANARTLPSVKKLSREIALSENLIRKAYECLVKEGVVVHQKRAGYIIRVNKDTMLNCIAGNDIK